VNPGNESFQAIRFAADDDLLLGETVLALGNPFGLGVSVSRGILSSKTRRPPVEDQPLEMEDWLQTDAAINPGNSGGPLVNLKGELIGLNVAIFREGQGIGFAVPVKRISEAISEIFTPEQIKSLWFGARFRSAPGGVMTASVEPESPAAKAGLREGDVIVLVNGRAPLGLMDLSREIVSTGDNRELRLEFLRGRERGRISVQLIPETQVFNAGLIRQKLGLTVQELPSEVAAQMRLGTREGLLITAVEKNSPGGRASLIRGDVLRAIDGRPVENVKAAAKMLYSRKAGEVVELSLFVSRTRSGFIAVYAAKAEVTLR
jgi:S1-C subfamily serine protease